MLVRLKGNGEKAFYIKLPNNSNVNFLSPLREKWSKFMIDIHDKPLDILKMVTFLTFCATEYFV